jgi:RNA polymerase sigma-70 factor, ECF subfamily
MSEQLVEEYYGRVQGYVRLQVPEQDCEDVIGDIFLRAVEKQDQVRGDGGAWLFAVARTRVCDYFRQKGTAMNGRVQTPDPARREAAADPGPLDRMEMAEFRERLRARMGMLTEVERDVIAFKFTDGLSNIDIARTLGMPSSTLGVVLHRALGRLRKEMAEEA